MNWTQNSSRKQDVSCNIKKIWILFSKHCRPYKQVVITIIYIRIWCLNKNLIVYLQRRLHTHVSLHIIVGLNLWYITWWLIRFNLLSHHTIEIHYTHTAVCITLIKFHWHTSDILLLYIYDYLFICLGLIRTSKHLQVNPGKLNNFLFRYLLVV